MFTNILVPISGDEITRSELTQASILAKKDNAKLTLVYVSNPLGPYMYSDNVTGILISEESHRKSCDEFAQRLFKKAKATLPADQAVEVIHIFHPNIADGVIDAADQIKADVILMTSHKRTGLHGFFLRSEAHEVILCSKIPVLVLDEK
ncbi:MAG: universal stress protein [Betaproteobacteria bacterium]|jgi:nucleotide-binding universal stress UspA family protein